MNSDLSVSVIIPTCDRPDLLDYCLNQVLSQASKIPSVTFEVIVCDDSRSSATKDLVEKKYRDSAIYIKGPRSGPGGNRNAGVAAAKGLWIVFIDDDCIPTSEFLSGYVQAITVNPRNSKLFIGATQARPEGHSLLMEAPNLLTATSVLGCSCNFAINREVFGLAGGFDERYAAGIYGEDVEFGARLEAHGVNCQFLSDALVIHPVRRIPGARKLARRWEGKAISALDYGASVDRVLWNLPWHALRVIQSRFRHARVSRENLYAAAIFTLEWLWVLYFTPTWVKKWHGAGRSPFWKSEISKNGPPPKFGF
jgi:GT2 family glycosyltransferase